MVRLEETHNRPSEYSTWHRTLTDDCPTTDIDYVEWRNNGIAAFIETKRGDLEISEFQEKVYRELNRLTSKPIFLVRYYINEKREPYLFKIWTGATQNWRNPSSQPDYEMSEPEYRHWLSNLYEVSA